MKINIASPDVGEEEIEAVARVMRTGILAQGPEVFEFEKEFAEYCGTKHAIAVSNGSTALLVALEALKNQQGFKTGEVITTPFTFLASSSSIMLAGLTPVFVDIDPDTFNMDVSKIEEAITGSTVAIMPVQLYGQTCEMNKVLEIAEKYNLKVIEDCAQAHGAKYHGKTAGSIGDLGCFSFYPTKNMTTGEGGMVTTNNSQLAEKCRLIRAHGMSSPYQYDYLGFNHRMTSMGAAIGRVQLKKLPEWTRRRQENAQFYDQNLKGVQTPVVESPFHEHVYHQYTIKCADPEGLRIHLASKDIGSGVYYPAMLYDFDIMKEYERYCPIGEEVCKKVLSLPVHSKLTQEDLQEVVTAVNEWSGK